ncbi:MAG: methanogenesis marker 17 protein, partial [Candidatus Methanomethylicaceae archaeon]
DLSDALRALWSEIGRDRVEQIGRQEILVKNTDLEILKNLKIRERTISISDKIIELITRILPEGFRIRHFIKENDVLIVLASEDPIKKDWIDIALGMIVDA